MMGRESHFKTNRTFCEWDGVLSQNTFPTVFQRTNKAMEIGSVFGGGGKLFPSVSHEAENEGFKKKGIS